MLIRRFKVTFVACLCVAWTIGHAADPQQLPVGPIDSPDALAESIPTLARSVIADYRETDRRVYLDNLFRLQLAAGAYDAAAGTIDSLRALDAGDSSLVAKARHVQYSILSQASAREAATDISFENAFAQAFRDAFARLDDRTSAHAIRLFVAMEPPALQRELSAKLDRYRGRNSLSMSEALELIKAYQVDDAYPRFRAAVAQTH